MKNFEMLKSLTKEQLAVFMSINPDHVWKSDKWEEIIKDKLTWLNSDCDITPQDLQDELDRMGIE